MVREVCYSSGIVCLSGEASESHSDLTSGQDELVAQEIRLVCENIWSFHLQLVGHFPKAEQVVIDSKSCNSLQEGSETGVSVRVR